MLRLMILKDLRKFILKKVMNSGKLMYFLVRFVFVRLVRMVWSWFIVWLLRFVIICLVFLVVVKLKWILML